MKQQSWMPTVIVGIVMLIIGAGGGFYAARLPQFRRLAAGATGATGTGNFAAGAGAAGAGGFRGRGGAGATGAGGFGGTAGQNVFGKVSDISATDMTITMMDGSSKIVTLSGSTQFQTLSTVNASTVKDGDTVRVIGPTNSDGSVTANSVMVNPPMPSAMPSGSPTATPQVSASPATTY